MPGSARLPVKQRSVALFAFLALTTAAVAVHAGAVSEGTADQTSAFGRPARSATSVKGEEIYGRRCAMCHDHAHDRIPMRIVIERKSPEGVIGALTTGPMRPMATGLSSGDIRAVAIYLTGKPLGLEPLPDANPCPGQAARAALATPDWSNWGVDLRNSRFQPQPGFLAAEVPHLRLKWAFAYPDGTASAAPIAVAGRLFLTTGRGLFALDAKSGCTYWHSPAAQGAKIVTASMSSSGAGQLRLFAGTPAAEVIAIDAATGKVIWTTRIDDHPNARVTGPVAVWRDHVYAPVSSMEDPLSQDPAYPCCTFRGSVVALDERLVERSGRATASRRNRSLLPRKMRPAPSCTAPQAVRSMRHSRSIRGETCCTRRRRNLTSTNTPTETTPSSHLTLKPARANGHSSPGRRTTPVPARTRMRRMVATT